MKRGEFELKLNELKETLHTEEMNLKQRKIDLENEEKAIGLCDSMMVLYANRLEEAEFKRQHDQWSWEIRLAYIKMLGHMCCKANGTGKLDKSAPRVMVRIRNYVPLGYQSRDPFYKKLDENPSLCLFMENYMPFDDIHIHGWDSEHTFIFDPKDYQTLIPDSRIRWAFDIVNSRLQHQWFSVRKPYSNYAPSVFEVNREPVSINDWDKTYDSYVTRHGFESVERPPASYPRPPL